MAAQTLLFFLFFCQPPSSTWYPPFVPLHILAAHTVRLNVCKGLCPFTRAARIYKCLIAVVRCISPLLPASPTTLNACVEQHTHTHEKRTASHHHSRHRVLHAPSRSNVMDTTSINARTLHATTRAPYRMGREMARISACKYRNIRE